jgi:hypothetical protein
MRYYEFGKNAKNQAKAIRDKKKARNSAYCTRGIGHTLPQISEPTPMT